MKRVSVTDLRRNLGAWLRRVRGGERLLVVLRSRPVASIEPYEKAGAALVAEPPDPSAPPFRNLRFRKLRRDVDPEHALAAVRGDRA